MTILRAGSMVLPSVAVRQRLLLLPPSSSSLFSLSASRCIRTCLPSNQSRDNGSIISRWRSRSFATSRQKRISSAMQQNETQGKKSIHGLRPNQTPSAAVVAATASDAVPIIDDSTHALFLSNSKAKKQPTTPLILSPSMMLSQPLQHESSSSSSSLPSSSTRDNYDHAHAQPAPSIAQTDYLSDDDNALRKLLLQQGILPSPPPRQSAPPPPPSPVVIPEADPSGVSHANPEDILNMASMYDPSIHLPDKPNFNSPANRLKYEAGTPMTDELIAYIGVRGPITVAEFMRRVLRDGRYGYYTSKGSRSGQKDGSSGSSSSSRTAATMIAAAEDDDDNDWDLDDDNVFDSSHYLTNNDSTQKQQQQQQQQQQHVGGEHVIGASGDFITAPEVSELFGESLLVWLITQYQTLGNPSKIQLIEIGPGKGTLICDILRSALTTFPDFASALTSSHGVGSGGEGETKKVAVGVHLVEVTDGMRARQKESLQKLEAEKSIMDKGFSFRFDDSEYGENDLDSSLADDKEQNDEQTEQKNTISINWHDLLSCIPTHDSETGEPIPTFIICQELLDALPIHSFQKIEGGQWRERLVDVAVRDKEEESNEMTNIKLAAGRRRKKYSDAESSDDNTDSSSTSQEKVVKKLPRLRFVLPPDTTPALRTLLRVNGSGYPLENNPTAQALNALPTGSVVEACPEGLLLVQDIADRIEKCNGGAALLIDYGEDGASSRDTMRGFWRHTQVHPLSRPGEVDVTADVDFAALRESVNQRIGLEESLKRKHFTNEGQVPPSSTKIEKDKPLNRPEAFGPVSQGQFLASMGIVQRVEKQIEADSTTDEQAYELYSALERLLAPDQMGERYKVLAIARKKEGIFPPAGF